MAYNFLIVDDSMLAREMVARTLQISGLPLGRVFKCPDGRAALDTLRAERVDCVLADINMPNMNGMQMVQHMADADLLHRIPVVIISTERSAERIQTLRAAGVRAFVNKPFTPEEIRRVLGDILKEDSDA